MSFADHAVLWLHLVAAIFTIGPGTAAIMSTPRYIRRQNTVLVGYLYRTTRIYSMAGRGDAATSAEVASPSAAGPAQASEAAQEGQQAGAAGEQPATAVASDARPALTTDPRTGLRLAAVERGRIAMMGGITAVIWLVILVLMVGH
jgi:hypothetical protein